LNFFVYFCRGIGELKSFSNQVMAQEYKLFLSYSRKDLERVKLIKDDLEQTTGVPCWMDLDGIESGEQFMSVIISAINRSDTLLFMMSEASMRSEWALDELDFAKRKRKRIVLVAIDDVEMTDKFYFSYHKYDIIDWNNLTQRNKLLKNIRNWKARKIAEEEAKREAEEEAKRRAKEEARLKAEVEAKRKVEEEAKRQTKNSEPKQISPNDIKSTGSFSIKALKEKPMYWIFGAIIILAIILTLLMCDRESASQETQKETECIPDTFDFSKAYAPWPSDSMAIDNDKSEFLPWEEIPATQKANSLNFEKWLNIMNHIFNNYWERPTKEMLADIGLEVLYEKNIMDEDSIKDILFMYGRQTRCMTDTSGVIYPVYEGNHAVLFEVFAYTSSGAEILFHDPVDLKDFMEQAIKHGVATTNNERYIVCDKPMGEGIHKIKKVYEHTEKKNGAFKELYYLNPSYKPGAEWQRCYINLDFLRHRIDVE